jgi:ATP-dependent protease ClpP protease subunit
MNRTTKRAETKLVPKTTGTLTGVLHSRRVPLRGLITERVAACCINRILILAADNKAQPIIIDVESPGGSVRDCLSIVRTMNGVSCPIATFSRGYIGGGAVMIAAHGVHGYRVGVPNTRFHFAQGLGSMHNGDHIPWHAVLQILSQDVSRPENEVATWLQNGADFDLDKAIRYGLVDVAGAKPLFPPA